MTNRFLSTAALLAALLATAAIARADEPAPRPLEGDLENGARLYRLHCASCHGLAAGGDGALAPGLTPKPSNLRDGGYLWATSDEAVLATIAGAGAVKGGPTMHGRGLTELDRRDILAWMKAPVPTIRDFFTLSESYIAHKHAIDQFGLERAEKVLGAALAPADRTVMVYTVFKQDEPAEGQPRKPLGAVASLIPEEPRFLYDAKPRRKIGFVGFVPLEVDGGTLQVALGFNRSMRLFAVKTVPAGDAKSEALRLKLDPILQSYAGSGGREEKTPVAPQKPGVKAPKDVQAAMLKAFTRVLEGAAMYEKEERERFWADPEAFKFPGALDMPDQVKFEFKEKKGK